MGAEVKIRFFFLLIKEKLFFIFFSTPAHPFLLPASIYVVCGGGVQNYFLDSTGRLNPVMVDHLASLFNW